MRCLLVEDHAPLRDNVAECVRELQDKTPVLIISARDSVARRIVGLDTGSDACLIRISRESIAGGGFTSR